MMRKRISDAETTPVRVVIVTMDGHLAGAAEQHVACLRDVKQCAGKRRGKACE